MTRQELIVALNTFHDALRLQHAASSRFLLGAVPVFKHHNARPPVRVRKHERRKQWGDLQQHEMLHARECYRFDKKYGRHDLYPHPEPDGA